MSFQLPFTHAILDDENQVIRKVRWSKKEVKWYKDTHPDVRIAELPKEKIKEFNYDEFTKLHGEPPY